MGKKRGPTGALAVMQKLREESDSYQKISKVDKYIQESKKKFQKNLSNQTRTSNQKEKGSDSEETLVINPDHVYIPDFKVDRKNVSLDGIAKLADNMASIGQIQPCTVRPSNKVPGKKFELVFGERRYRAALNKNLSLKVVVRNIDAAEAAMLLLSENENREDSTDFSLGEQLSEFLNNNVLTQSDLVSKLGMNKQKISRLLSFRKIPLSVVNAIGDISKLSSGTAEKIKQFCKKGEDYQNAIISIGERITKESIGHDKLTALVNRKLLLQKKITREHRKYSTKKGYPLFTVRRNGLNKLSIQFSKDISNALGKEVLQENAIYSNLVTYFEKLLEEI